MATYNGARFLRHQLDSILSQLASDDELIVSDDGSTDTTLDILNSVADGRVRILSDGRRRGYVRNFERSLSCATGDVIFLSDQDDVWAAQKLEKMKSAFSAHPDVAMVHHERRLIDESGNGIGAGPSLGSGVHRGLLFVAREGIKARLWGCALGMRRRALAQMLPFPAAVYAHDHWATIVGGLEGGVLFLPERLIDHRLHGANVTPKHGLSWNRRVVVRFKYVQMILVALARRLMKRRN